LITGLKRALSSQDFATAIQKKDAKQADIKSYGKNLNQLGTYENVMSSSPTTDQGMVAYEDGTSLMTLDGGVYTTSQPSNNQTAEDVSPIEVSSTSICAACGKGDIDIQIRPCNHLFHRSCVGDALAKLSSGIPGYCPLCKEGPITSYVFALPMIIAPISNDKESNISSRNDDPIGLKRKSPIPPISEAVRNSDEEGTDMSSGSTSSSASHDNDKDNRGDNDLKKISKHVQHMSIDKNLEYDDNANEGA